SPGLGGSDGVSILQRPRLAVLGRTILDLGDRTAAYAAIWVALVLSFLLLRRVVQAPFGHVLTAIRINEGRMRTLGYGTGRYKLAEFVLGGVLAGLAGARSPSPPRAGSPASSRAAVAEARLGPEGLTRRFGALAAVDGVTLRVERGTVHAIIGPNGAGKSTLLNLLSGELRASSGRVRFRGEDVTRAPPDVLSRKGIGRSYQTANVFPEPTWAESVWLAAHSRNAGRLFQPRRDGADTAARGEDALRACGLSGRRLSRAAELSYGEQRQLEVAMMLATDPELLLVDEPLAGLGHDEARMVLALLREVAQQRTLVLIEHDMDAVFAVAQTVTVLVNGRVLESGPPAAIRASPRVREAYLGEEEP